MDDAVARQGSNHRNPLRSTHPRRQTIYYGSTTLRAVGNHHTRYHARRAPGSLQAEAAELRQAKTILLRLYNQEHSAYTAYGSNVRHSNLQMICASRASAERRYVNCLIRYLRDANRMSAFQANELQKAFTRERMSDLRVSNSNFLLGMFPRELY
jgi:hypothetical protein